MLALRAKRIKEFFTVRYIFFGLVCFYLGEYWIDESCDPVIGLILLAIGIFSFLYF